MSIDKIQFKHPFLGDIIVNSSISQDVQEKIGDVVKDYVKCIEYYHAKINKNEDGTFSIKGLCVIKPESINVGWMQNSKGNKNCITVITNRLVNNEIIIYPSNILSIIYN